MKNQGHAINDALENLLHYSHESQEVFRKILYRALYYSRSFGQQVEVEESFLCSSMFS